MAIKIKILSHGITATAKKSALLADILIETGIELSLYCNKRGLCGKCFVEIVKGNLPPLEAREKSFLDLKHMSERCRLACKYKITGDAEIKIPGDSILQKTTVLETGIQFPLEVKPAVKKYYLELHKPDLQHPYSSMELIQRYFRKKNLDISLDVLKKIPNVIEKNNYKITLVVFRDKEILAVEPGDTTDKNFGLAVDIGTTTLVVELVNMNTGKRVDSQTSNNSQIKFGSDIISRLSFAYMEPQNLGKLQEEIVNSLSKMISRLLNKNKIKPLYVYEIVLAGNAPMNHFLLGIPVKSLAVAPYHAAFSTLPELSARKVGIKINTNGKAYVVPNIKSFIGGDISAGLLASNLANRNGNYLFIDLGTNGEIVLKIGRRFIATSTAAGPAFEGMNINSGMLALPGAIYRAEKKKRLTLHTIENMPPKGICGTGLIDLVAIFLDRGIITSKGKITHKNRKIPITKKIDITQKDIREIQLALAAIKSGIQIMLEKYGLETDKLEGIFIAGAFGNYLNIQNAMTLGLLPPIDPKKIVFIGNSSLAGAKALLLSEKARKTTETLIQKIQHVSLATNPKFQKYFISALDFGWRNPADFENP
ncbi:MAG TPA: ASKHA domain-containing protein [Candidatus Heimdallarchaeota archaeon]|nr:ASKHA domain-containing protein [Candidatus Heimdallarchaeota archaeon]